MTVPTAPPRPFGDRVLIVAPRPDMALVAKNAAASGKAAGLRTTMGTLSRILVHAALATAGLSAI